jgi:3-methyladenine DNA glycosylase AlkD
MTYDEVIRELKSYSNKTFEKIFDNHGAQGQLWGVKVKDLKKIQKKIKKDHDLALRLFDSGVSDAQYLAGLIADETKMTIKDLQHWAETAGWQMISEYTVAWIAAESMHGWKLGLKWIDAKEETIQSSGWATLANFVSVRPDEDLDIEHVKALLERVQTEISAAPNRVRYTMNGFVIAVGSWVKALTGEAQKTGYAVGKIKVDMGNTACKVPFAPDYIQKVINRGTVGKKKKMARC